MKIVTLAGGLGNQMFQYAFGRAWSPRVRYDLSWFRKVKKQKGVTPRIYGLGAFNVRLRPAPAIFRLLAKKIDESPPGMFDLKYLDIPHGNIFGFFQSEKYFLHIRDELLRDFSLCLPLNAANTLMLACIRESKTPVSMHIRHGDFVKVAHIHPVQTPEYYMRAIDIIKSKVKNPHFFVFVEFSNELDWVQRNIDFGNSDVTFVDINDTYNCVFDLELMKNCKHNIIANSSMSWWGAWLNENPDKIVIAPKQWCSTDARPMDRIPDKWILL